MSIVDHPIVSHDEWVASRASPSSPRRRSSRGYATSSAGSDGSCRGNGSTRRTCSTARAERRRSDRRAPRRDGCARDRAGRARLRSRRLDKLLVVGGAGPIRAAVTMTKEKQMTDHKIGTREEWTAARNALLAREKEHTRHRRRARPRTAASCPGCSVETEYTLPDRGRASRLSRSCSTAVRSSLIYHFMFGPDLRRPVVRRARRSPTASTASLPHLHARDVTMLVRLAARRSRSCSPTSSGWAGAFTWVSIRGERLQLRLRLLAAPRRRRAQWVALEGEPPPIVS